MKCTNCQCKIPKHNTICTSCRNRTSWVDLGDASVGLALFWLFSLVIMIGIAGVIAGITGNDSENVKNAVLTIIPLAWTVIMYALLFWMLGPEGRYTCDTCQDKNDGPMYLCPRCGKLNVNKGLGNHFIGVFMGFSMIMFTFVMLSEVHGNVVCMVGTIASVGGAIGLFIPIGKYKAAMLKLEKRLPDIQTEMYDQQTAQYMQQQYPYPYLSPQQQPPYPPPPPQGQQYQHPPPPPPTSRKQMRVDENGSMDTDGTNWCGFSRGLR